MQQNRKLMERSKMYHIPFFSVFIMHKPGYVRSWDQDRVAKQVFWEGQVHVGMVDNGHAMVAVLHDVTMAYQSILLNGCNTLHSTLCIYLPHKFCCDVGC